MGVVRLAIERETEVIGEVVMAGIDQGLIRQLAQLTGEGIIQLRRVAAAVALLTRNLIWPSLRLLLGKVIYRERIFIRRQTKL